jgi:Site-specific recombinases, DNA invertase Pin homologs
MSTIKIDKVWLYTRISKDSTDGESIENQKNILLRYAKENNMIIKGESSDNDVSGMHFKREGIAKITEAVNNKLIDTVLVKDLSRLGRNNVETLNYIEWLYRKDVRVFSISENIDTLNEDDDLHQGLKALLNDLYSRDLSKKIRTGYEEKFKNGFFINPPYGYFKDLHTKKPIINQIQAEVVKQIFNMYINGYSPSRIAIFLTRNKYPNPSSYIYEKQKNSHQWNDNTIRKILSNESYNGTLICGQERHSRIYKWKNRKGRNNVYRHPNYYPMIIDDMIWFKSLTLRKKRSRVIVNKPIHHKYTGMLICSDCGKPFFYCNQNKNGEIFYNCSSYRKYGKAVCCSKRITENEIERQILFQVNLLLDKAQSNLKDYKRIFDSDRLIEKCKFKIQKEDDEIKNLILLTLKMDESTSEYERIDNQISSRIKEINKAKSIVQSYNEGFKILKTLIRILLKTNTDDILEIDTLKSFLSVINISGMKHHIYIKIILKESFEKVMI